MFNLLKQTALFLVFLFGAVLLNACGGGGGGGSPAVPTPSAVPTPALPPAPPATNADLVATCGNGLDECGAFALQDSDNSFILFAGFIPSGGEASEFFGATVTAVRGRVTSAMIPVGQQLQALTPGFVVLEGQLIEANHGHYILLHRDGRGSFDDNKQLCLLTYVEAWAGTALGNHCYRSPGLSYAPDLNALAFNAMPSRPFALGDSGFSLLGNWDGDDRRADIAYDFGDFSLWSGVWRVPAASASGVFLPLYRVGIMPKMGEARRLFVGFDDYRNGWFAYSFERESAAHKFSAVAGKDGMSLRYEWRYKFGTKGGE